VDIYKNYQLWGSSRFESGPGFKRVEVGTFEWGGKPRVRIAVVQEAITLTREVERVLGFTIFPAQQLPEVRAILERAEAAVLAEPPEADGGRDAAVR
jgi:hypothetical protein